MYPQHSHRHPRHPGRHGHEEFARGRGFDFGPGFGPGRGRSRGGPRARRGDVRAAVLALLADRPMHGYEMIKEIEERSEGAWTPSAGSIYPMLQLLEDEGLIRGEDSDGKRRFTLTDAGRAEHEEKSGDVAPWDAVRAGAPTGHLALRESVGKLFAAVRQVGQAGDEDQRKQVTELLDETRRKVYAILAEDKAQDQE
ncbi:MAG TPA: PadR family transcriptional regulator [Solirubrobacterales bacterium]|nr:PadR family transcriptional regulator [Solirubrobacterales bacterium]